MLFRRDIEPSCSYCCYGTDIGRSEVACIKRGIMSAWGKCGAFKYEPTKRVPEYARTPDFSNMSNEDFSL